MMAIGGDNIASKKSKQTKLDSFIADFSAESSGSGLRPRYEPVRDEVHTVEIVDTAEVSNDYGTSTMVIVNIDGQEHAWFLKGYENTDFQKFADMDSTDFPRTVEFARVQNQSSKNPDRMVNRLHIRTA